VVYFFVVLFLAWLVNRLIRFAIQRAIRRDKFGIFDQTTSSFLMQLMRIVIFAIALVIYAHLIPSLRSVGTALLAGVSVASDVIGLAAQNTLGNLVAGIALLIYRPVDVGDRVQLTAPTGVETGVVESLTLGYTILVTGDNRRVVVPNAFIANQVTINVAVGACHRSRLCHAATTCHRDCLRIGDPVTNGANRLALSARYRTTRLRRNSLARLDERNVNNPSGKMYAVA
jgi:small-conductance mechanosensitive channel